MQSPISRANFLQPKFLKPLGTNPISQFNPLRLFPDGIPGYIAPQSRNLAPQFFFHNRSFNLAKSSYTPQVRLQERNDVFPRLLETPQELESEKSIARENREVAHFGDLGGGSAQLGHEVAHSDRKMTNKPQHPTININLKSNLQSHSVSDLAEVNLHPEKNESITPSEVKPIVNREITPGFDFAEVNSAGETIISASEKSHINREIDPDFNNVTEVTDRNSNLVISPTEKPTIARQTIASALDNVPEIASRDDKIASESRQITSQSDCVAEILEKPTVSREIASKSDSVVEVTSENKAITSPEAKPTINHQITPRSDNVAEIVALETEEVTSSEKPTLDRDIITRKLDAATEVSDSETNRITDPTQKPTSDQKAISPKLDTVAEIANPETEQVTSSQVPPTINRELIAPGLDTVTESSNSETDKITPSGAKSTVNHQITPQSDNVAEIADPETEQVTSSQVPPTINRELIAPRLDTVTESSNSKTNQITDPRQKPTREQAIDPKLDTVAGVSNLETDKIIPSETKSTINREIITPKLNSVIEGFEIDKITPSQVKPTINRQIAPQSNTLGELSDSERNTANNSEQTTSKSKVVTGISSTPNIVANSSSVRPFSVSNLLRKALNFFSLNNIFVAKKEETPKSSLTSSEENSPPSSSDRSLESNLSQRRSLISPKENSPPSPKNQEFSEPNSSVPDTWSSISELINEPSPSDRSSENTTAIDKSNTENISPNKQIQNKPNNSYSQTIPTQNKNSDRNLDRQVYKLQLLPEDTMEPQYQRPSNSYLTTSKRANESSFVGEIARSTISPKEDIPVETVTLNEELEVSDDESELLETLAEEIYGLLQQRIEIERERQGKYYR